MQSGWTVVLDVGKTLAKATLWDEAGHCVASRVRLNRAPSAGGGLTLDAAGIERWLEFVLKEFVALGPVGAIIPVAHGAAAVLIRDGRQQCAPIDYEWRGAALDRATYDKQRDPFSATGSPALPAGLNLGIQLHWLESLRSGEFRAGKIVPWAQYWAWLLCGEAASEVTSLGCHTDLWRPFERRPSDLAELRGWSERLAPVRPASACLGRLTKAWVNRTGLSGRVEVYCGLHDSNAALVSARSHAEMRDRDATVLSTGTWFVAMRTPASDADIPMLPETRDCLINVDVAGNPIPSARFMGGRELELLIGSQTAGFIDVQLEQKVIENHAIAAVERLEMLLPSPVQGVGPFPNSTPRPAAHPEAGDITALAHLYAALVADVSLDLISSCDTLLIDGRFARAPVFVRALARLRPDTQVFVSSDEQGVAHGALSLVGRTPHQSPPLERVSPLSVDMSDYRQRFRTAAERLQ